MKCCEEGIRGEFVKHPSLTYLHNTGAMIVKNLVATKVGAKHELLLKKPT
jgi:hypothetical protein